MIRNSVKLTALGAIALFGGAIGMNCSKGSSGDGNGNLKIAFAIAGGDSINLVHYQITSTSGGATLLQGDINTSDHNANASLDVALPATAAGLTDTVVLSATTVGGVSCATAPTTFTVTSGANTNVMLAMVCGTSVPQNVPGTVLITTTVTSSNSCPSITTAVVAPAQTSVGATAAVSTTGVDPDVSDSLTYAWGPAANFAAPTLAATTYTCTTAGVQPINLTISDGKCQATVALQINCIGSGTGTGGAAGASATGGTAGGAAGASATGGTAGGAAGASATGGTAGASATGGTAGSAAGSSGSANSLACATCEFNDTAPPLSFCSGTTVSGNTTTVGAFGCDSLTGGDVATCKALVQCLRGTACQAAITGASADYAEAGSNFDDPHPCLCGSVSLQTCLGATSWTGPCAAQYVAAAAGGSVLNNYGNSASPVGLANNLMTCDVDSQVPANGLQACGANCGLGTASAVQ